MHFEDIWNDAEKTASKFEADLNTRDKIVQRLKATIDVLEREDMASDHVAQEGLIGTILFDLAAYCMEMQRSKKMMINSARAMKMIADSQKIKLLDPDEA